MAIAGGIALCGLAVQPACNAQSAASSPDKKPSPRAAISAPAAQAALVDFAAMEESEASPRTAVSEPAMPVAAAPDAAHVAAPVVPGEVLKEIADMKEKFAQAEAGMNARFAKREAEMNERIERLEAELKVRSAGGDVAAAERDASALRAAETGEGGGSMTLSQSVAAPVAAQAPPEITAEITTKSAPFPGDWTWLNSNGHQADSPMATKYFTPEFRADANYSLDYNHPEDDSLGGSTETFRSDEWQLEQISAGGDIRIDNVRGRILTMDGMFATTTPRNDGSVNRGQWDLDGAYKYVSEAWGGYHWNVSHGLNVDAGIFVSYIGLFSYYNFDNWTYQPSFVSSNTPWFFNGLRIQWFPTEKLKIEPWIINGWQSYARFNGKPGLGGQILYRPNPWLDLVWNNYGLGEDDAGFPGRSRVHADYSAQLRFYDSPKNMMDKIAWTITGDAGCEYGGGPSSGPYSPTGISPEMGASSTYSGGVNCHNSANGKPKQMFTGWMSYLRFWFDKDLYAVTIGGGQMNNPGRYLTLLPPINGATAISGTPYFTENAGDRAQMHDGTITFDYMPSQFITFRLETGYRYSDVPYWSGRGGVTPPGGNNGNASDYQCAAGGDSGVGYGNLATAVLNCQNLNLANGNSGAGNLKALWWPDLRTNQTVSTLAIMVRF
jgi:hypothetical protein